MSKIRIYFSHPIRGVNGNNATIEEMESNNEKAIDKGFEIDMALNTGCLLEPKYDIYIPAEHDEFVIIAYQKGYINETQLLDVDCEIVKRCQLLLIYNWQDRLSKGMSLELKTAVDNNIPIVTFDDIYSTDEVINKIKEALNV